MAGSWHALCYAIGKGKHHASPAKKKANQMQISIKTRTEPEAVTIAEKTLEHINWTGLSLFELIEAGRVHPEPKEIIQWIKSACGPAVDLEHLKTMNEAAQIISSRFIPA